MQKSATLVFFGNERLSTGFEPQGAPTLEALLQAGYHVAAVVVNQHATVSRKARSLGVEDVAKQHNIPVLAPAKLSEIRDELAAIGAVAGVLVAYGRIIPQSIIDIFPRGILNIHPSLLPLYRGSTPIEQAMLDGVSETGVSVMGLVKAMDAGPIFAQARVAVPPRIAKYELTAQLLSLGGKLVLEVLPAVLTDAAQPALQNESLATYTPQITKEASALDLKKPATHLEREVRAFAGWPKSKITIFGQRVIALEACMVDGLQDGTLVLPCKPGFLEIQKLIAPSGRTMTGPEFIRGYKK